MIYRAFYATALEAQAAASGAVTALNAKWKAATTDAGAESATTTPVAAVRFEAATEFHPLAGIDAAILDTKITGPDGRSEIAALGVPTSQSDALITAANGVLVCSCNTYATATVTSRVATAVQVFITSVGAVTFAGTEKLQDRVTGKKYKATASTIGPGAVTLAVTEDDATDLNDVTFGTVLEFVAPPAGVDPLARVNTMAGFTVTYSAGGNFTAADGTKYFATTTIVPGSSVGLGGDYSVDIDVQRDDANSDDLDYLAISAAVGDELAFISTPTNAKSTATIKTARSVTIPKGTTLTLNGHAYETTVEVISGDTRYVELPFKATEVGSASNTTAGDSMAFDSPITGIVDPGNVYIAIDAAGLPVRYGSQLVGAPVTWTSRVSKASDGRWMTSVFTLPEGS